MVNFKKGVCYRVKDFDDIKKDCVEIQHEGVWCDYLFVNGDEKILFTASMYNICGKTFIASSDTAYTCALGWFLLPQMCEEVVSEEINFNKYVHEAMRTKNNELNHKLQLLDGACGLAGESGEVVDAIKKYNFQGHDLDKVEIENELGDVLWYVALICDTLSINLEEVAKNNLEKLRTRYPEGFSAEDSLKRIDKKVLTK